MRAVPTWWPSTGEDCAADCPAASWIAKRSYVLVAEVQHALPVTNRSTVAEAVGVAGTIDVDLARPPIDVGIR